MLFTLTETRKTKCVLISQRDKNRDRDSNSGHAISIAVSISDTLDVFSSSPVASSRPEFATISDLNFLSL